MGVSAATAGCGSLQSGFRAGTGAGRSADTPLDIDSGTSEALTEAAEGIWDFRQSASPDGKQLLFCRAPTGAAPTIWVAGAEGEQARPLTQGWCELGADHPRWL